MYLLIAVKSLVILLALHVKLCKACVRLKSNASKNRKKGRKEEKKKKKKKSELMGHVGSL